MLRVPIYVTKCRFLTKTLKITRFARLLLGAQESGALGIEVSRAVATAHEVTSQRTGLARAQNEEI